MRSHLAWYVARAGGIVAWGLAAASILWGLLLSTRLSRGRPRPNWLLDLHRFLGGLAVAFAVVHMGALVADSYVEFGVADLLVPFASEWRPAAVAWGVVAFYILVAVEVTSLLMRKVPRRIWLMVHHASYLVFALGTLHAVLAGTDARHPAWASTMIVMSALVVFLTLVRVLSPRKAAAQQRRARAAANAPAPPAAAPERPTRAPADTGRPPRTAAGEHPSAASSSGAVEPA